MDHPVCIIGAGRSGTNLLGLTFDAEGPRWRNLFENRYIWTYGQRNLSCDRREASEATDEVKAYIRRHFADVRRGNELLIDKTPSNAFRIPFVAEIFPDTKFIHIIRDGRDNILSRQKQWEGVKRQANSSQPTRGWKHNLAVAKDRVRHFRTLRGRGNLPLDRIPVMLSDSIKPMVYQFATGKPLRWAERVSGLPEVLRAHGVDVAAAVQWRETVMAALVDGRKLGSDRYHEIRYENFLKHPIESWRDILEFLGEEGTGGGERFLRESIVPKNTNKWRHGEGRKRVDALETHLRPTLEFLGYPWEQNGR